MRKRRPDPTMVNKGMVQAWVDALNSGKWPESRGFIKTTEGFDAIGVLCDLVNPQGWQETATGVNQYHYKDDCSSYQIPDTLREEMGLPDALNYTLVEMIDKRGFGHKQIADFLRVVYLD